MSNWVICQILGLFVNTLTACDNYALCNSQNLLQPIQVQLSKKNFLNSLLHFWNINQIFNVFKNKMKLIASVFKKLQTSKDVVRQKSEKVHFRKPFDSQHAKGSQTLKRPSRRQCDHIFITLTKIEFENFCVSYMWNFRTAC